MRRHIVPLFAEIALATDFRSQGHGCETFIAHMEPASNQEGGCPRDSPARLSNLIWELLVKDLGFAKGVLSHVEAHVATFTTSRWQTASGKDIAVAQNMWNIAFAALRLCLSPRRLQPRGPATLQPLRG